VLAVRLCGLCHLRADDATVGEHPLVASLQALRHLVFFPTASVSSHAFCLALLEIAICHT
jgi:hypothetical protein